MSQHARENPDEPVSHDRFAGHRRLEGPIVARVEVAASDPSANLLLSRAVKWIRRIEERVKDMPPMFLDCSNPKPLREEIEAYLKSRNHF